MTSTTKANCDQYYWLLLEESKSSGSTSGSESDRPTHGSSLSSSPTAIVEVVALVGCAAAASRDRRDMHFCRGSTEEALATRGLGAGLEAGTSGSGSTFS